MKNSTSWQLTYFRITPLNVSCIRSENADRGSLPSRDLDVGDWSQLGDEFQ